MSHMTWTPLSRLKVKVNRWIYSPPCWRIRWLQQWPWERVGHGKLLLRCRLLGGGRRFAAHGGRGAGAYRGGRPPTACWQNYAAFSHDNLAVETLSQIVSTIQDSTNAVSVNTFLSRVNCLECLPSPFTYSCQTTSCKTRDSFIN